MSNTRFYWTSKKKKKKIAPAGGATTTLSPGQPSLVHSQEPWRHTLQEKDNLVREHRTFLQLCICARLCSLTRCCSPERYWILEGNVFPCAHRNTEIPPRSAYRPKPYPLKNKDVTTARNRATESGRGRCRDYNVTWACTAIHTLFLTDLLDVQTMAGCRAGLGAFTVLHPNWTLRDWKHIRLFRLLMQFSSLQLFFH